MSFETELKELLQNRNSDPQNCPVLSQKEKEKEEFRDSFSELTLTLIKPTLLSIKKMLKAAGEKALIKEIPYSVGPSGREHLASVSIYIEATAEMDNIALHRCPHVSFLCDPCNKVIRSHKNIMAHHNHGGTSYTTGSFTPEELQKEIIEEKVMEILREIYAA